MNYSPERERIECVRERIDTVVGCVFVVMLVSICAALYLALPAMSTDAVVDGVFRFLLAAVITIALGMGLSRVMTHLSNELQDRFAPPVRVAEKSGR